ncbi:MAG: RHS repeat-associated core domain-containing protein [Gallionella sp.]
MNGSTNPTFSYDANGNMVSGAARTVTWNSFNMPAGISNQTRTGLKTASFLYNPEHERTKEQQSDGSTVITLSPRYDTGLHFEKKYIAANGVATGAIEYEHYLYAGGQMFGKYITTTATDGVTQASTATEYYSRDNLGSMVAITDATGTVTQRMSYDIWGKRRYPNGFVDAGGLLNNPDMVHGFTGHEMLDDFELIHMNGRLYDPVMARFVSADPTIQSPGNLQSYNRYTYGWNNPLSGTDPSGFSWWTSFRDNFVKPVVIAAVSYYTGGLASSAYMGSAVSAAGGAMAMTGAQFATASLTASIVGAATAGFTGGMLMSGGNLDYAFKSAIAGGLTAGLGGFGGAEFGMAGRIAGQGIGSGVSAQMFGGDFTIGLRYGLMGAFRSEAFQYMKTETDKLASTYWGSDAHTDANGSIWTFGGRGCGAKGSGGQCDSWFPWLMGPETGGTSSNPDTWTNYKFLGVNIALGTTPVSGVFANMISKTHDYMNNALSVLWKNGGPTLYGDGTSVRNYGYFGNGLVDVVSFAGMLPAAQFTSKALWQPPLSGK